MNIFLQILLQLVVSPLHLHAKDSLICDMVYNSNASTLRIDYIDQKPQSLYLRSPGDDEFRLQNMRVEVVSQKNELNEESFVAKPIISEPIDWSEEPHCFKEIGTQWYFMFRPQESSFLVQLVPYFARAYETCQLPRFQPQTHPLFCG